MSIKNFVEAAKKQNDKNLFEKYEGKIDFIPEILQDFYKEANPLDVEVVMKGSSIRFYPAEELLNLQHDYELGNVFCVCYMQ